MARFLLCSLWILFLGILTLSTKTGTIKCRLCLLLILRQKRARKYKWSSCMFCSCETFSSLRWFLVRLLVTTEQEDIQDPGRWKHPLFAHWTPSGKTRSPEILTVNQICWTTENGWCALRFGWWICHKINNRNKTSASPETNGGPQTSRFNQSKILDHFYFSLVCVDLKIHDLSTTICFCFLFLEVWWPALPDICPEHDQRVRVWRMTEVRI